MSTKNTQREVGSVAWLGDIEVRIQSYSKGWYVIEEAEMEDECEVVTHKVRAKQLTDEPPKTKRDMSGTLRKYRDMPDHYKPTVAYSGRQSLSIGDTVAEFLDGMSPAEVLKAAERILGLEQDELTTKYAHLNPGQQRMNGGNRIRAALKRGDIKADDLH